jgi:cystathionine beta-synthase/cysteine synthase A
MGAVVHIVTEADDKGNYQQARIAKLKALLATCPSGFWPNQYGNPDNPRAHGLFTAAEISRDVPDIDTLVASVSTGGHISGISKRLKETRAKLHTLAVDVEGSAIFGSEPQQYLLRGLGLSWTPENLDATVIDSVHVVTDAEALRTVQIIACREGILVGESSGAALFAALHRAHMYPSEQIVVLLPDGGDNYFGGTAGPASSRVNVSREAFATGSNVNWPNPKNDPLSLRVSQ